MDKTVAEQKISELNSKSQRISKRTNFGGLTGIAIVASGALAGIAGIVDTAIRRQEYFPQTSSIESHKRADMPLPFVYAMGALFAGNLICVGSYLTEAFLLNRIEEEKKKYLG